MSNEAPTDALRLVPTKATPQMIAAMDKNIFGYKMGLGSDFLHGVWAAALAAAPASPLPEGGGWQDIGTAPKDGTRVIGLLKSGRAVTIVSHKHHAGWVQKPDGGWIPNGVLKDVWSEEESSAFVPVMPTHWMPLPAAPTGEPK